MSYLTDYDNEETTLGTIEDRITTDEAEQFGISIQSVREIEWKDD